MAHQPAGIESFINKEECESQGHGNYRELSSLPLAQSSLLLQSIRFFFFSSHDFVGSRMVSPLCLLLLVHLL